MDFEFENIGFVNWRTDVLSCFGETLKFLFHRHTVFRVNRRSNILTFEYAYLQQRLVK
jgi:hypothetical protein